MYMHTDALKQELLHYCKKRCIFKALLESLTGDVFLNFKGREFHRAGAETTKDQSLIGLW